MAPVIAAKVSLSPPIEMTCGWHPRRSHFRWTPPPHKKPCPRWQRRSGWISTPALSHPGRSPTRSTVKHSSWYHPLYFREGPGIPHRLSPEHHRFHRDGYEWFRQRVWQGVHSPPEASRTLVLEILSSRSRSRCCNKDGNADHLTTSETFCPSHSPGKSFHSRVSSSASSGRSRHPGHPHQRSPEQRPQLPSSQYHP